MAEGERQQDERSPREHILVDGEHVVAPDERIEQRQVEGKRELREQTQQVAANVAHLAVGMSRRGQDQHQRAAASHQHAQRLLARDGLLQNQCRQDHGEDRHRRRHDGGIDGRRDAESQRIAALVAHQSEHRSPDEHQLVAPRHMLLGGDEACQQKQQTGPHHAERHHRDAVEAMRHGVLAHRSHQAPSGAGPKHTQMRYERFIFLHRC